MAHLVALLTFVVLAAAPHYRLVRAAAVGAVAVTSFMPFHLGYAFGVLAWFSAVYGWLGLPPAQAARLVLYLAAASLVARLAVVAFVP